MSNNKQSSIDWLFEQLEEKGGAWENASIRRVQISIDVTEYLELKRQAKAMHKEEIIHSHLLGLIHPLEKEATKQAEDYYNETFCKEAGNEPM